MNYKSLIPAILTTLFVVYMSSRPDQHYLPVALSTERIISNLAHIPVYAAVTFFWLRAFIGSPKMTTYMIIIGVLLFSVSDEIHQSFVPGRTPSLSDIGLDLIGMLIGLIAINISRKINLN